MKLRSSLNVWGVLLSLTLLSCSGTRTVRDFERMSGCYLGMPWYSWGVPYHGAQVTVLGPRSRESDDAELVLLAGAHQEGGISRDGLYLFHEDSAYFYGFSAALDPNRDYVFRLDFESSSGEVRKLWAHFSVDTQRHRNLKVYSHWSGDDHVLRLTGQDVSDAQARQVFAAELVQHIHGMRPTYESQQTLANGKGSAALARLQNDFLMRLETCSRIEEATVHSAVNQERAKIRKLPPGSVAAPSLSPSTSPTSAPLRH